jgi:hypothetical protein
MRRGGVTYDGGKGMIEIMKGSSNGMIGIMRGNSVRGARNRDREGRAVMRSRGRGTCSREAYIREGSEGAEDM